MMLSMKRLIRSSDQRLRRRGLGRENQRRTLSSQKSMIRL